MKKTWFAFAPVLISLSTPVFACDATVIDQVLVERPDSSVICTQESNEPGSETMGLQQIQIFEEEEKVGYWDQWNAHIVDDPMVSADGGLSHVGVSIWQPNDEKLVSEMAYSEWVMSHGLQLSLGLGESSKPKVRLDYQWHDIQDDKLTLQVEVPF